jgi:hypothetical protein
MRRTIKKNLNLNKLKTGCSPCLKEVKIMQQKIAKRQISDIKIQEIKNIVSSLFKEKEVFDVYKYKF